MKMEVLIVVKAYPALSKKYNETVCTAGITKRGDWIRIYPMPFRKLEYKKRFQKYEWIEIDLERNTSDFRPESYRPFDITLSEYKSLGFIPTDKDSWHDRRKLLLKNVYTNLDDLISEAKDKEILTSLAIFKPTKILDFVWEEVDRTWDDEKIEYLKSKQIQFNLFENENQYEISEFEVVNKLPYKFSFIFLDDSGRRSKLMIEDWETGMLYWNSLVRHKGDEKKACEDVKKRYFDDFALTKDYHFILGTTKLHHLTAPNPFVIIGDFRPKYITQESLF